jgi:GT2 family glycosyltransferase
MKKQSLVSVVIPTHNRKEKLIRLIQSIQKSRYQNLEIIVVDDASTDGTYEIIKKTFPKITAIRNEKELLPSGSRNVGIKYSTGDFIFLIDDDNIINRDSISNLVIHMKKSKDIIASPLMLYYSSPSVIWCAGGKMNHITYNPYYLHYKKDITNLNLPQSITCDYNPNAYMISRDIVNIVGYFDESRFPIAWEETDFFIRARRHGFTAKTITSSKIWHDITWEDFYHINAMRSFHRGRSRILFYCKYAKWRLLLSAVDILYFSIFVIFLKGSLVSKISVIVHYFDGMLDGITSRISRGDTHIK